MDTTANPSRQPAPDHFAVYEHIRPDTGQVFYVGKGSPNRLRTVTRRHNKFHSRIYNKMKRISLTVEQRIIAENLPEESAHIIEKMRIAMWRAAGVALVNATDGGEGFSNPPPEVRAKLRAVMSKVARNRSPEHRAKLNAAHSNISSETRAKMSAAAKARTCSEETRAKIGAAGQGRVFDEQSRAKKSASLKGRTFSIEHRANLREAATGRSLSAETRAKMSATRKGCEKSIETRAKMSAWQVGRTLSDETRAKIKAAALARWERKRAAHATSSSL